MGMTSAATVTKTGLEEMGANRPWYWRVNVLKTIKMALVRPLMPDFKVAIKADGDVLHVAPPPTHSWNSPLKALTHWLAMECWLLGPSLPSPWLPASRKEKKKQDFLSTNLASQVLAFQQWAARLDSITRVSVPQPFRGLPEAARAVWFVLLPSPKHRVGHIGGKL